MENNNNWRVEYRDLKDPTIIGTLTDTNHLSFMRAQSPSDYSEKIFNLYKKVGLINKEKSIYKNREKSYKITNWGEKYKGRELTVFYMNDKLAYWQPTIELEYFLETMKEISTKFTWGYVDGRAHHLGMCAKWGMSSAIMFPGYVMWIESIATKPATKTKIILENIRFKYKDIIKKIKSIF